MIFYYVLQWFHYHRTAFLWLNGGSGGVREGEMEDNDVRSGKMMKG